MQFTTINISISFSNLADHIFSQTILFGFNVPHLEWWSVLSGQNIVVNNNNLLNKNYLYFSIVLGRIQIQCQSTPASETTICTTVKIPRVIKMEFLNTLPPHRLQANDENRENHLCRYLLAYLDNIWCVRILCVVCTRLCIFKSFCNLCVCQFSSYLGCHQDVFQEFN